MERQKKKEKNKKRYFENEVSTGIDLSPFEKGRFYMPAIKTKEKKTETRSKRIAVKSFLSLQNGILVIGGLH